MSSNTTCKEEPTGGGNLLAGLTDTVAVAHVADSGEVFNALRGAFALQERRLHIAASSDDTSTCWAERWGLVRYLPTLHDAALFLAQIGARL